MGRTGLIVLNTVLIALVVGAAAGFAGWQLGSNHEAEASRNRLATSSTGDDAVVRATQADTGVNLEGMTCQAITSEVIKVSAKVATSPDQIISIYQPVTVANRASDFAVGKLAIPVGRNDVEVLRCEAQALFEDTMTYPIEYWATVDVHDMVFLAYRVAGDALPATSQKAASPTTGPHTAAVPPAARDNAVKSDLRNMIVLLEQCYVDAGRYPKSTTSGKASVTFVCGDSTLTGHLSVAEVPGETVNYVNRGETYTVRITASEGIAWHYDSGKGGTVTRG